MQEVGTADARGGGKVSIRSDGGLQVLQDLQHQTLRIIHRRHLQVGEHRYAERIQALQLEILPEQAGLMEQTFHLGEDGCGLHQHLPQAPQAQGLGIWV